jgi:MFS family permease
VAAAVLVSATLLGLTGSIGALVPAVAAEYGIGGGTAAILVTSATAVQFALSPVAGRLGDAFGPRRIVLAAGVAGAIGFGALAWAPGPGSGVPAYAAGVGTCGAGVTVPLLSALTRLRGAHARCAVALFTGAAQAGSAVGAPALGMGLHGWGLRPTCAVAVAALVAVALLGAGLMPTSAPAGVSRRDRAGWTWPALARRPWLRRLFVCDVLCSSSAYLSATLLPITAVTAGLPPARVGSVISAATAGGLVGRLVVPLVVRPSLGAVRVAHLLLSAGTALWLTRPGPTGLLVVALVHGVAIGSWTVLENLTVAGQVPDAGHSAVFGALLLAPGLGVLVSVAGTWALVDDVVSTPLLVASLGASLTGALVLRTPAPRVSGTWW